MFSSFGMAVAFHDRVRETRNVTEGNQKRRGEFSHVGKIHVSNCMLIRLRSSMIRMKQNGSRPWNTSTGLEPTGGNSNYFFGNDPKAWRTDIPHYARLIAPGVYDGVDLVWASISSTMPS